MPACVISYIFSRFYFFVSIILRTFAADFSRTVGMKCGEPLLFGVSTLRIGTRGSGSSAVG